MYTCTKCAHHSKVSPLPPREHAHSYVRVWSGVLRVEGPRAEGDRETDAAESRARLAFGMSACALRAVDIAVSRLVAASEVKVPPLPLQ